MRQIFISLMLLCSIGISAQDVIVKKNGSTILCRIVELSSSEIVYKKWTDQGGANYVMERADAISINYENGQKIVLSESELIPNVMANRNTSQQQLNDNSLLKIDFEAKNIPAKVKKLKRIGWIGGSIFAGIAIATFTASSGSSYEDEYKIVGRASIAAGCIWTGSFLIAANHYQKKINAMVVNTPIWQSEFNLKNGGSIMAGMDLLKDKMHQSKTIGLGLRYNF